MKSDNHSAAGPAAGYAYQFERALYWLAKSPSGCLIGIETCDDVSVKESNGTQLLEQDKHSIQKSTKPFGDRSKDLWKTLVIWLEALDSQEFDPLKTKFLMVTNKVLEEECIARKISDAKTIDEADSCIQLLKSIFGSTPKGIEKYVERVLRPDSGDSLQKLIVNCELADGSDNSAGIELREKTIAELQLPEWCAAFSDSIVDELRGWLDNIAQHYWQKGEPAWIKRDNFVNQLHAIIENRNRKVKRERAENLIPIPNEQLNTEKGNVYVKQIYLVTDEDGIVENAMREFIRCNIEKLRLSEEGNITDDDWRAFDATLQARWEKIWQRVIRMQSNQSDEDIGFEIFSDTTENYREKLAGSDTEQVYLTAGTYHRMANLLQLGWHPQYQILLKQKGNGEDI